MGKPDRFLDLPTGEENDPRKDKYLSLPTSDYYTFKSDEEAESFYKKTLPEIEKIQDYRLVEQYNWELEQLKTDIIAKGVIELLYGESIETIFSAIEKSQEQERDNYSYSFFPNHIVTIHRPTRESKTKKTCSCYFCACIIRSGSPKITWRPLLIDHDTKEAYILNHEIIVCPECSSNLPINISELETLNDNMLGESFYNNGVIDIQYDHLAGIIGGELYPKRLERKR